MLNKDDKIKGEWLISIPLVILFPGFSNDPDPVRGGLRRKYQHVGIFVSGGGRAKSFN